MKKYFPAALDFVTSENFYLYLMIFIAVATNFSAHDALEQAEVFGRCGFLIACYFAFRVKRLEKQLEEFLKRGG